MINRRNAIKYTSLTALPLVSSLTQETSAQDAVYRPLAIPKEPLWLPELVVATANSAGTTSIARPPSTDPRLVLPTAIEAVTTTALAKAALAINVPKKNDVYYSVAGPVDDIAADPYLALYPRANLADEQLTDLGYGYWRPRFEPETPLNQTAGWSFSSTNDIASQAGNFIGWVSEINNRSFNAVQLSTLEVMDWARRTVLAIINSAQFFAANMLINPVITTARAIQTWPLQDPVNGEFQTKEFDYHKFWRNTGLAAYATFSSAEERYTQALKSAQNNSQSVAIWVATLADILTPIILATVVENFIQIKLMNKYKWREVPSGYVAFAFSASMQIAVNRWLRPRLYREMIDYILTKPVNDAGRKLLLSQKPKSEIEVTDFMRRLDSGFSTYIRDLSTMTGFERGWHAGVQGKIWIGGHLFTCRGSVVSWYDRYVRDHVSVLYWGSKNETTGVEKKFHRGLNSNPLVGGPLGGAING